MLFANNDNFISFQFLGLISFSCPIILAGASKIPKMFGIIKHSSLLPDINWAASDIFPISLRLTLGWLYFFHRKEKSPRKEGLLSDCGREWWHHWGGWAPVCLMLGLECFATVPCSLGKSPFPLVRQEMQTPWLSSKSPSSHQGRLPSLPSSNAWVLPLNILPSAQALE